jgi:uncharacterized protein (UPF0548 family)
MASILKPSPARLQSLLKDQEERDLSYPEVGATRGALPPGYRHGTQETTLGHGATIFNRAVVDLRSWQAQRGAGVGVTPSDAAIETATTVVLTPRVAGVYLALACRIVYVVAEPHRFGFAYGTLPHHILEGEEAFVVERDESDSVRFSVTAFVRPRGRFLRLLAPFVDEFDQWFVRRYMRSMDRSRVGP